MPASNPRVNVLVEDQYTRAALSSYSLQQPLRLRFSGSRRNLENELSGIEEATKAKLHPLLLDLYNIAVVVYVWDLNTQRGIEPRDFCLLISVSNRDRWLAVKEHLEATLRFLTGDNFEFHFVQGKAAKQDFAPSATSNRKISLFSGGLDSLAGVKWLIDHSLNPVLVSHEPRGLIAGVQEDLFKELKKSYSQLEWQQIRAGGVSGTGLEEKEYTQFSRSFLYLTLGSLFALQLGSDSIYIFENGVLALNIPLTQARVYSNTRTAHPAFLQKYERLLADLFGCPLKIDNPFLYMTKGEVVKLLDADGIRNLLPMTVSCPNLTPLRWSGVALSKIKHCGICFPCVVRRIAVDHSGLWDNDGRYKKRVFGSWSALSEETKRLLFEIADFGRRLDQFSTVDDAFVEFPQFYVDESVEPATLFEMLKRQVEQMKHCFATRGSASLNEALNLS